MRDREDEHDTESQAIERLAEAHIEDLSASIRAEVDSLYHESPLGDRARALQKASEAGFTVSTEKTILLLKALAKVVGAYMWENATVFGEANIKAQGFPSVLAFAQQKASGLYFAGMLACARDELPRLAKGRERIQ